MEARHTQFDKMAIAVSTGMPRRQVFKAFATAVVAAASGVAVGARQRRAIASSQEVVTATHRAAVLTTVVDGHRGRLVLPDRASGRLWRTGHPAAALVPHILDEGVELSIYDASSMTLTKRLMLPLGADPVPVAISFLPGVMLGAAELRTVSIPVSSTDCSVDCCYGGGASGCEVWCSSCDPNCGHCCDSGCCHPPPPPC